MDTISKLFRKYSLTEVSKMLGVLPGELARYLGQSSGLPARLLFDEADISKIQVEMGLKAWWSVDRPFEIQDDNHKRRLVREMSQRILQNGLTRPQRYDNLLRGLAGEEQALLRIYLNALIKKGILSSEAGISSLELRMVPDRRSLLEDIAAGKQYPLGLDQLWSS